MKKEDFVKQTNPLILKGICHRGLHNEKDTENGLRAFKNAKDAHMALELDVHLTKDKKIVVFHDSEMKRVTGKEGIIEDLTLQQIKEDYRLLDGEVIPTLKEVFDLIQEEVPIVLELKVFRKNYKELSSYVREELKAIKDKRNIVLISFDPRALLQFKKDGYLRQLLLTTEKKYRWIYLLRNKFEAIDVDYKYLQEKKVQRYSKHHFINAWTIESEEVLKQCLPYCDTVTFQLMDQNLVQKSLEEMNR